MSLRQESLGREEEPRTQKPFNGSLRVRIPPGKAGPAARSESCVVVGRPTLRSVDSEIKGRVIEPRKLKTPGAFVVDISGGRVRRCYTWSRRTHWSCRGRRTRTMIARDLQEPGRPVRLHRHLRLGNRNTNSPEPTAVRPGRWEQIGRKGGIAGRSRSLARGTDGSRSVP